MARSVDAPYEALVRSTSKQDWLRVNPKDSSKRYKYAYDPSITISYRHYREWTETARGWQTKSFTSLDNLITFVKRFPASRDYSGYITANGTFRQGYTPTSSVPQGWRNIAPTDQFTKIATSAFQQHLIQESQRIFEEVQEWRLTWKRQ